MSELDLNTIIREKKLEEIVVFLNYSFPGDEHTRENALNLVVENFYSKYFTKIIEANESK
jgi:hypothetical protein